MLAESVVLSLIIGKLRGFKLTTLEKVTINKWWLIVLSFLIEASSSFILKNNIEPLTSLISRNYLIIHFIIYLLLFIFIASNLSYKSFYLILLGSLLNFIVIMANKGFMPVSIDAAKVMGFYESISMLEAGKVAGHAVMIKGQTLLWFLGDIINIFPPYPLPQSISIGDIFISLGVFVFLQREMRHS